MGYQYELTRFSINFKLSQVNPNVLRRAKIIILDSLTAIIAGNQTDQLSRLHNEIMKTSSYLSEQVSSVYGTNIKLSSYVAAMINGIAMVTEEMDEGNPIAKGHPACHFIPSLLTYSEQNKVSGYRFLESFIVGYEIGVRAGASINLKENIHPHGNWGLIGSGFAIGKLHNFTEIEYKRGLSLCGSLPNITLWKSVIEGHRIRDVFIGLNNMYSCIVPSLVRAGFSGSPSSIEEIYGNGILGEKFSQEKIVEGLGKTFSLMNTYFKFYPFCRFCHSPIDGILKVLRNEKFSPQSIEKINVYTYSLAAKLSNQEVNNEYAGKFSIPYAISSMFFNESKHEEILGFAKKVFVFEDDELTKLLPYKRNSRLEVMTKDNKKLIVEVEGARGDAHEEDLEEKVIQKCSRLLETVIGPSKTAVFINQIMDLESVQDMRPVIQLLNS
ncbi:MmgE/PrpD family protein [Calidifontibacillus oryziterrae]|uniref:MmgE/PrpD family protein n=1 Tax=Calidifontibacillus oryziterrae TaxID=1191699 RepID=UPI00030A8692|nr:MmgE/PrpD family protein [Calidifontibacillus oryziterrae]